MVKDATEAELQLALEAERGRQAGRLDGLLAELARHGRWLTIPLPPGLRERVVELRRGLADEVADLLLSWQELGGEISLRAGASTVAAPEPAVTVPVPEPAPEPVPEPVPEPALEPVPEPAPAAVAAPPLAAPDQAPLPRPAKGPVAPAASLAALKAHLGSGGAFKTAEPRSDWTSVVAGAVQHLSPGKDLESDFARLQKVIDARESWKGLPQDTTVRLMELVAARLRAMQELGLADRRVDAAFSAVSSYAREERPGHAWGLDRKHPPKNGTWASDAAAALLDLGGTPADPDVKLPKPGKQLDELEVLVAELPAAPPEAVDAVHTHIRRQVSALLAAGVSVRHARLVRIVAAVADDVLPGPEFKALRRAVHASNQQGEEADPPPDGDESAGVDSVLDALLKAESAIGDHLVVWRSAKDSARSSEFGRPGTVYEALKAVRDLAQAYYAAKGRGAAIGPWEAWFEQRGFRYAAQESETTMNLHGRVRTFTFQGQARTMQRHLTLGGGDRKNCLQLFFDPDDTQRKFIVGYCGNHLPYAGQGT
ncbi:MAG: hypothetical protein Q8P18_23955 [Pseudomonadota bacterium]|nr:hypothetical protein [Pseudomonadota bacterium]